MPAEVESMFSAREVPWHRLGTVTDDVLTAEDAIVAAGLDWEVEKEEVFVARQSITDDGVTTTYEPVPNRFALTRNIDQQIMSVVSDVYKPFQNKNAFSFMDELTGHFGAKYETAGSLRGGRVIFVTLRMENSDFTVGDDVHNTFLLLRTTHDGSGRISVYVVTVRVVCMNTLTWAINGARHSWGVTHTADVTGKVAEAREALGLTATYTEAFQAEAERLLDIRITEDDLRHLLDTDLPEAKTKEMTIELMLDNFRSTSTITDDVRETGWGALNAVSEFEEHVKPNKSGQAAFSRLLDGRDAKLRTTLKNQMLARA